MKRQFIRFISPPNECFNMVMIMQAKNESNDVLESKVRRAVAQGRREGVQEELRKATTRTRAAQAHIKEAAVGGPRLFRKSGRTDSG